MSFQTFDWEGLIRGDEIEVIDDGLVISRGVIEEISLDRGTVRLQPSYGKGRSIFRQEDGWQLRAVSNDDQLKGRQPPVESLHGIDLRSVKPSDI